MFCFNSLLNEFDFAGVFYMSFTVLASSDYEWMLPRLHYFPYPLLSNHITKQKNFHSSYSIPRDISQIEDYQNNMSVFLCFHFGSSGKSQKLFASYLIKIDCYFQWKTQQYFQIEKLPKRLKLYSGCTGCQNTPLNLLRINISIFIERAQEPIGKEKILFTIYSIHIERQF